MDYLDLLWRGLVGYGADNGILVVKEARGLARFRKSLADVADRVVFVGEEMVVPTRRTWEMASAPEVRRRRWRPVPAGVSVGHIDITAGTLGWFGWLNGREVGLSNAHVLTPDPSSDGPPPVLDVVQPGVYDGGTAADRVGFYHSHIPIRCVGASGCRVSGAIVSLLNWLAGALGRKTRFVPLEVAVNYADFALMTFTERTVRQLVRDDGSLGAPPGKFVGLLFAGGGDYYVVTKISRVLEYYPSLRLDVEAVVPRVGDRVVKCGRTTGCTEGVVESVSFVVRVTGYPCGDAVFADTVLVRGRSAGGDSGSSVWLVE